MQTIGEISLIDILKILLKKLWLIILITIVFALGSYFYTKTFISPTYMSTASLYVTNGVKAASDETADLNDLNASEKLVASYIVVLQSDNIAQQISEKTQLGYSAGAIKSMIKMSSVNETQVLQVQVTSKSRKDAQTIANAMLEVAPSALKQVAKVGEVETLDTASEARQVSPSLVKNTMIGFLLGLVLSIVIILIQAMLDRTIKGEEDFKEHYDIAVLGSVPDFRENDKGGYRR